MTHRFVRIALVAVAAAWLSFAAAAQSLIRDTEIEDILREYTDPILEAAGLVPEDVGLFIINDPSLNAFVANGQRIHLHTGLIVASETPGQLKGVIAHETCHIACGHSISRARAASVASRPALISIGLGILAIAAGAPDAGAALIASSQQFAALNFFVHTRAEEATADQKAVDYLAALGESPAGLVEFFDNFRYQEVLSEARRFPYFRTHPLASDRIQTLRNRAEETGLMDTPPSERSVRQLEMMQAKIIGFLYTTNYVYQKYPQDDKSDPAHYARSIAALQAADVPTALRELEPLLEKEPENPYYHELKGDIFFRNGKAELAVEHHARAVELAPGRPLLLVNYAQSLLGRDAEGDVALAEQALRDALIREPNNAYGWSQLAIALDKQGRRAEAQLATAERAFHIGDYPRAQHFSNLAIRGLEPNTPLWRQASDIASATDPRLAENARLYRRR
ncbi:MAG: M48 family metalloprotease [Pseudomonadota bacterium]